MQSEKFSKILIVNPYGIGDVLFTTPLIRQVKRNVPDCFLGCLLGSRTGEVLRTNPYVDEIFSFDKGKFDNSSAAVKIKMFFSLVSDLKKRRFDLLIDISNAPEYALWAKFFLGIKTRVGFNYRNRGRFLTQRLELKGYSDKHIIEYYLDLLRPLGFDTGNNREIDLPLSGEDKLFADEFLENNGVEKQDKLFCVVPGGGRSWGEDAVFKRWPEENFAQVCNKVYEKWKLRTLILGDNEENNLCAKLAALINHKCINACGKAKLRETAALMARSEIVLANDGGPLHLAVSQGVRTVSVFGPVDEKVYGPYPHDNRNRVLTASIDCRPCYRNFKFTRCRHRNCLKNVYPRDVLEGVKAYLT